MYHKEGDITTTFNKMVETLIFYSVEMHGLPPDRLAAYFTELLMEGQF